MALKKGLAAKEIISQYHAANALGGSTAGQPRNQGVQRDKLAEDLALPAPTAARAKKLVEMDRFVARVNFMLANKSVRDLAVAATRQVTWTAPDWNISAIPPRYAIDTDTGSGFARATTTTARSYDPPNDVRKVRVTPITSAGNAKSAEIDVPASDGTVQYAYMRRVAISNPALPTGTTEAYPTGWVKDELAPTGTSHVFRLKRIAYFDTTGFTYTTTDARNYPNPHPGPNYWYLRSAANPGRPPSTTGRNSSPAGWTHNAIPAGTLPIWVTEEQFFSSGRNLRIWRRAASITATPVTRFDRADAWAFDPTTQPWRLATGVPSSATLEITPSSGLLAKWAAGTGVTAYIVELWKQGDTDTLVARVRQTDREHNFGARGEGVFFVRVYGEDSTGTRTSEYVESDTVTVILPSPSVTVEIAAVDSVRDGQSIELKATATGPYDRINWSWSISEGGGTITQLTQSLTESTARYTAPTGVGDDQSTVVGVSVTAFGDGTAAKDGERANDADSERIALLPLPNPTGLLVIDPVSSVDEGKTIDLRAELSGDFDSRRDFQWLVDLQAGKDVGTIRRLTQTATESTARYTAPKLDSDLDVTIRCGCVVQGDGVSYRDGVLVDTFDTEELTVNDVPLPDANVNVAIDAVGSVIEDGAVELTARATGDYDTIDWAWGVTSGGGRVTRLTQGDTTSTARYRAPFVDADSEANIGISVTARGTGTKAEADTVATDTDQERIDIDDVPLPDARFTRLSLTSPGTLEVGDVVDMNDYLTVTGNYDAVDIEFDLRAGVGRITSGGRYTATAAGQADVRVTATARGTGRNYRDGSSLTRTDRVVFTVEEAELPDPSVSISSFSVSPSTIDEGDTARVTLNVRGVTYDDVDSVSVGVEAVDGDLTASGSVSGIGTATGGDMIDNNGTFTPGAVNRNTRFRLTATVVVSGDGTEYKDGATDSDTATDDIIVRAS